MDSPHLESGTTKYIPPNFHLKLSLRIIYYMGTWPPQNSYFYLYLLGTICSFIFILGFNLAAEIANLIIVWGNVPMMAAGSTVLMTNSAHAYKLFVILFRQSRIRSLLSATRSELFTRDNERQKLIVSQYTWKGLFHYAAYQCLGATTVFCWGISPIADMIAGRSRHLPMEGWYPFNTTATPAFEIVSAHQGITIIAASFQNVAMDTLVTGLMTVACCQFALLKQNIASINIQKQYVVTSKVRIEEMKEEELPGKGNPFGELMKCIEHFDRIFQFAREIENIFGTMIFFQFFVNCFIICLIAFHISQMTVYIPEVLLGMTAYLCCMIYQIFIYCWHGNEIHLHGVDVAFAAYSNNWWNGDERFKRASGIVITRAHKPVVLVAGNIMSLSLQTFVAILRMSYSIFTVLQTSTGVADS